MTRLAVAPAVALSLLLSPGVASRAAAQFPKIPSIPNIDKVVKGAQVLDDLTITPGEEQQIGEMVSQRIRDRYGVMQDRAVHRYVTLVGTLLAQASAQPKGAWRFIVLDTGGVKAFAAPGGYIHVTRGALGLIRDEAELAGGDQNNGSQIALNHFRFLPHAFAETRNNRQTLHQHPARFAPL